ncbi:MAG: radical SAM protein [Candidatus Omnitrophota bacterium]|jgi:radical SAM superfamily enzyme YgiQ (UPF0313 family)
MNTQTITLAALNRNTIYTPLALLYCRACLEKDKTLAKKISVELKEYELDDSDEFILWELVRPSPRVIGFSCYLWNIEKILKLCRMIRRVMPGVIIILGGPEVSPQAREILQNNPEPDLIVRGEGEFVFTQVIKTILKGKNDFSRIEGLTFRAGRRIIETPGQPPIANLDAIPSVYRDKRVELSNREVCIETQRGCVFGCGFCYYNKGRREWRTFSIRRVKKELAFLLKHRDTTIYLMDPVFNIDLKRSKEICRFIIKHNPYHIPFHTEIQAELVDRELAVLLKKANMRFVEVGLQSGNEHVLRNVQRPFNRERFIQGFTFMKNSGLTVELQLILGLPGETLESFKRSLDFALSLDPPILSVFKLHVLPGTTIRAMAASLGIEYEKAPPYESIKSTTLPFTDSITAQKIVNSVSLFRRNNKARQYCKTRGLNMTELIHRWLEHLRDDSLLLNGENNKILENETKQFINSLKRRIP